MDPLFLRNPFAIRSYQQGKITQDFILLFDGFCSGLFYISTNL